MNKEKGIEIESKCKGEPDTSLMGYSRDLFRKENYKCVYCGKYFGDSFENWMQLTREHVIPYKQLNGDDSKYKDDPRNLRAACSICNNMKTRAKFTEFEKLPFEERVEKTLQAKRKIILDRRKQFENFYDNCVRNGRS